MRTRRSEKNIRSNVKAKVRPGASRALRVWLWPALLFCCDADANHVAEGAEIATQQSSETPTGEEWSLSSDPIEAAACSNATSGEPDCDSWCSAQDPSCANSCNGAPCPGGTGGASCSVSTDNPPGGCAAWCPNQPRGCATSCDGVPCGTDRNPSCQTPDCCPAGLIPVEGDAGANNLSGTQGNDCLTGLEGNDLLIGASGADWILAGPGDDDLHGEAGDDFLAGGAGGDMLVGGDGRDELHGNLGDDSLDGGGGADVLVPGPGADTVDGGEGDDTIIIQTACSVSAGEVIRGGPGFDRVKSALPRAELEQLGVTFESIEEFVYEEPYTRGSCEPDADTKLRCECCDDGWGGERCQQCVDPDACGPTGLVANGVPRRTTYTADPVDAFEDGVYAESVAVRTISQLPPATYPPPPPRYSWRSNEPKAYPVQFEGGVQAWGSWALREDGSVWTMGLASQEDGSIGLELFGLSFPAGSELWAYTEHAIHGPVSATELGGRTRVVIPPLPGDTIYVEIFAPPGAAPNFDVLTARVSPQQDLDESCFTNVACIPGAEDQFNGTGRIVREAADFCSATLINAGQGDPLVITAEHCLSLFGNDPNTGMSIYDSYTAGEYGEPGPQTSFNPDWMYPLEDMAVEFHNRTADCNGGGAVRETLLYDVSQLVYHDHNADIAVLQLGGTPDPVCVTYNGYDASGLDVVPASTVSISYPDIHEGKISIDTSPPERIAYEHDAGAIVLDNYQLGAPYLPFWAKNYNQPGDVGWFTGGSSGGAVFDHRGYLIGALSGWRGGPNNSCEGNPIDWVSGRLASAMVISELHFPSEGEEQHRLQTKLGAPRGEMRGPTASDPFPLLEGPMRPCVGQSSSYRINPRMADHVWVDWEVDSAPNQLLIRGEGTLLPNHTFINSITPLLMNPNGPEPEIKFTITAYFGPGHEECGKIVREFTVQPELCSTALP